MGSLRISSVLANIHTTQLTVPFVKGGPLYFRWSEVHLVVGLHTNQLLGWKQVRSTGRGLSCATCPCCSQIKSLYCTAVIDAHQSMYI